MATAAPQVEHQEAAPQTSQAGRHTTGLEMFPFLESRRDRLHCSSLCRSPAISHYTTLLSDPTLLSTAKDVEAYEEDDDRGQAESFG